MNLFNFKTVNSIIILWAFTSTVFAQKINFSKTFDSKVFKNVSESGWVVFEDNLTTKASKVFEKHSKAFGLNNASIMVETKVNKGENGYQHIRHQQKYENIPVEDATFLIHSQHGKLKSGSGTIYSTKNARKAINIRQEEAITTCLKEIGAKIYNWQIPAKEAKIKIKQKNEKATYYPKAEKVFVFDEKDELLKLCFKFYIQSPESGKSHICYVETEKGSLIRKTAMEIFCDGTTVTTSWYGLQPIFTDNTGGSNYEMQNNCTLFVYGVYDYAFGTGDIIENSSGNLTWDTQLRYRAAGTSIWTMQRTYDAFKSTFNRNAASGSDSDIDIYQDWLFPPELGGTNNASYSYDPSGDDEIKFGAGPTGAITDDYNTLDIMAHEFTHGVDQYEGNLKYEKESGALDESFSDIFGEWVESRLRTPDWLIGGDRIAGGMRSFINANNRNDPNMYLGNFWVPSSGADPGDNWGVHINSGAQNQMFYYLTMGFSGWNNGQTSQAPVGNGYFYNVYSIGIEKSIRIAYHVLVNYMSTNSNYYQARNAWVQAATEIYGECSFEAIQTGKAWDAAGIGPPINYIANGATVCGNPPTYLSRLGQIFVGVNCPVIATASNTPSQIISGTKVIFGPQFRALAGSNIRSWISDDCKYGKY